MKSLLPSNESQFLRFLELLGRKSLQDCNLKSIDILPKSTPSEILPQLALMFDIDITNLNEEEARKLLSNAILMHKNAGTPKVLKTALNAVFKEVEIKEWFAYAGTPFTFRVKVSEPTKSFDERTLALLDYLIEEYKNVRSVLEAVELEVTSENQSFNASVSVGGEILSVLPYQTTQASNVNSSFIGAGIFVCEITKQHLNTQEAS